MATPFPLTPAPRDPDFLYSQTAGIFTDAKAVVVLQGMYRGNGVWNNHSQSQDVHDHGPLPAARYTIGPLHTVPHLGSCMSLTPALGSVMFGRSGFFIHLDNPAHIGGSSDGCVVCSNDSFMTGMAKLEALEKLRAAGQDQLQVVDLIPDAEWPAVGAGGPITAPPPVSAPAAAPATTPAATAVPSTVLS